MHGPWLYLQPRCLYYCSGYDLYPQYAPSLKQFLSGLFASLVIFDAMYHYWHRLHHLSRPLYSHIHRIHHEYFSPFVSRSYHILCRLPAQAQVTLNSTNQVAINMHPKPNVGLGYSIRASTWIICCLNFVVSGANFARFTPSYTVGVVIAGRTIECWCTQWLWF